MRSTTPMSQDKVEKRDVVVDRKVDHRMLNYLLQLTDRRYQCAKMSKRQYEIPQPIEGNGRSKLHQKVHWYDAKCLHDAKPG